MRICFAMWDTGRSGGTRVLFEVGDRLARRGHDVVFVSLGARRHGWFDFKGDVKFLYPEERQKGKYFLGRLIERAFTRIGFPFSIERIRILAQSIPRDCDVTVATFCFTAFSVYRAGVGKMFYYVQHYEPLFFNDPYLSRMVRETYYLPLTPLVVSRWLYDVMRSFGRKPIYVGNAVNHDVFYPRNYDKEDNAVLSIFRGIWWKGDDDVIKALNLAGRERKIKLIAVGRRKTIEKLLAKNSPISFDIEIHENPTDDELASLYSKAKLYISASLYEGFSLPPLEAMACGTPVITTDSLGVREYAVNGFNSIVVQRRDVKALAKAIIDVLSDDSAYEKLRKGALETAMKFTWSKVVDRVEKAFIEG